jgi:hypothetical protein
VCRSLNVSQLALTTEPPLRGADVANALKFDSLAVPSTATQPCDSAVSVIDNEHPESRPDLAAAGVPGEVISKVGTSSRRSNKLLESTALYKPTKSATARSVRFIPVHCHFH